MLGTAVQPCCSRSAAAAAQPGNKAPYARLSSDPAAFTLEVLKLLRKPAVDRFHALLVNSAEEAPPAPRPRAVSVGHLRVVEAGPLAGLDDSLDATARRVLPGHLLRRCIVLSSLRLGRSCRQRVAITGCTGEEVVLAFHLMQTEALGVATGEEPPWRVLRITRDASTDCDVTHAVGPHPRLPPETVVLKQLQ